MSNTNGTNSFNRSLNGIITYDDGAGTVIQNGTAKTETLITNNIQASNLTTDCILWEYNTGVSNYSTSCLGTVNFATGSKGNVNIGPVAGATSSGALNIGTATNLSGNIVLGSQGATSSVLKLQSYKVECQSAPTTANGVVNKTYADLNISNLLAGTNIWTGPSNTFNNVIYASTIQPIAPSTILTIGNATANPVGIQTSDRVVMGLNPSTYNTTTGNITGPAVIVGANGTGPYNAFIDFYTYAGTLMGNAARIIANSGGLSISNYLATKPLTLSSVANVVISAGDNTNITSTNSTNINCGTTNISVNGNSYHEMLTTSGNAYHDYHSYTGGINDYDARILCSGGTLTTNGRGTMNIEAGSIKLLANTGDVALQASSGKVSLTGPIILNGQTTLIGSLPPTPVVGQLGGCFGWNQQAEGDLDIVCYKGGGLRGGVNLYNQQTSGSVTAPVLLVKANITDFYVNTATANIAATSAVTLGVGQIPVTLNGIAFITGNNVSTTRGDYATFGGTQISWNRSGGSGENNFICYQGPGGGPGGLDIANVSTTGVYTTIMTARVDQINCVPRIVASNGICFNKGNITTIGYMFCNGTWTGSLLGAGNALTPVFQSFGLTFSTVPKLQLTLWTSNTAAAMGVIVSFHSVTTTDFYICAYNARAVNAPLNAWGVHWTATGGY